MTLARRLFKSVATTLHLWVDSHSHDPDAQHKSTVYASPEAAAAGQARSERMDWVRCIPFILVHLVCLLVFLPTIGFSWAALGYAVFLYLLRMHAITGWYHRYFSHRSFKTNRFWQFVWAFIGNTAAQRGPLWWAAHHRHHHRYSDEPVDIHSPIQKGFWWSHMGWFTARANFRSQLELVPDLAKFPELVLLDRSDAFAPLVLGVASWGLGVALAHWAPGLGTSGWQMLIWFFISTVFTAHATFTINSLAHVFGTRRYATSDTSRNNFLLALLTLGEGWHNNHHHYQATVRQGFRWWEVDITWYLLVVQSWFGIVRDMKGVPAHVLGDEPQTRAVPKPVTVEQSTRGSTSTFVAAKASEPAA